MPEKIGKDIDFAAECLKRGELVAIPTETVYGLAANALSEEAVLKIFEAKKRPFFDPLIVHISDKRELDKYVQNTSTVAEKLIEAFWPGPLTLILPKKETIPDLVTSGSPYVGIRMPDHPLTLELLRQLHFPLAAPSANPFGYISPTLPRHVFDQLGNEVFYILDGGECRVGLESTIIGFKDDKAILMRLGGIPVHEIEKITGPLEYRINQSSNPSAPGQLKSHYAPGKPFHVGNIEKLLLEIPHSKAGIISFSKQYTSPKIVKKWILSPSGNMHEAAHNLFRFMREADASDTDIIFAEYAPEAGLGLAINDRLRRAAAEH